MNVKNFRELLSDPPFSPFRLVMSSGKTYEVRHPEMAYLAGTDLYVAVEEVEDGVPARYHICSLLHVTSIEPLSKSVP